MISLNLVPYNTILSSVKKKEVTLQYIWSVGKGGCGLAILFLARNSHADEAAGGGAGREFGSSSARVQIISDCSGMAKIRFPTCAASQLVIFCF